MRTKYFLPVKSGDEMTREGTLQFVPVAGMSIDPGDGNFYRVEEVFWNSRTKRLDVWFDDSGVDRSVRILKSWGWQR